MNAGSPAMHCRHPISMRLAAMLVVIVIARSETTKQSRIRSSLDEAQWSRGNIPSNLLRFLRMTLFCRCPWILGGLGPLAREA